MIDAADGRPGTAAATRSRSSCASGRSPSAGRATASASSRASGGAAPSARASGQLAYGAYNYDADRGAYLPYALQVLAFDGPRIGDITGS